MKQVHQFNNEATNASSTVVAAVKPIQHRNVAHNADSVRRRFVTTLACVAGVIAAAMFVVVICLAIAPFLGYLALVGWLALIVYCVMLTIRLVAAKGDALTKGESDAIGGFVKFVAWNPTEGMLILKNKIISHVDDDPSDGGGLALLFPFLGEEVALRVPLEVQTLHFEDRNVLTREYVPLGIKCTVYWRIVNLEPFYLFVSREIHHANDAGDHAVVRTRKDPKLEAAEQWLKNMVEEETRRVISRVSTGLLLAARVASEIEVASPAHESAPVNEYKQATEGLAGAIFGAISERVTQYGLELHRVALQEVDLPAEICHAAVTACKTAYLPLQAQREGQAAAAREKEWLKAQVELLGRDAVATKQIFEVAPKHPTGRLAVFLEDWLERGLLRYDQGTPRETSKESMP